MLLESNYMSISQVCLQSSLNLISYVFPYTKQLFKHIVFITNLPRRKFTFT